MYGLCPPPDCAPQDEVLLIIWARPSLVTVFSGTLEMDSHASMRSHLCPNTYVSKSCFDLEMQEMVSEQRNTRGYSTPWPDHRTQECSFCTEQQATWGLRASPGSWGQAPWHGLCTRLCTQRFCLFRREDSSAPRGILFHFTYRHHTGKSGAPFKDAV